MNRFPALAVLMAVALTACRHPEGTGSIQPEVSGRVLSCEPGHRLAPRVAAPVGPDALTGVRAQFVAISRTVVGGFAGLRNRPGQMAILLADTSRAADVRAALLEIVRSDQRALPSTADLVARAPAIQVKWTLAELYDWLWHLEGALVPTLQTFGAAYTSSGVDDAANRVFFDAQDSSTHAGLLRALESLSLPCELVTSQVRPISIGDGW